MNDEIRVKYETLVQIIRQTLAKVGAPAPICDIEAQVMAEADLQGVPSHGVRMSPGLVQAIREGRARRRILSSDPARTRSHLPSRRRPWSRPLCVCAGDAARRRTRPAIRRWRVSCDARDALGSRARVCLPRRAGWNDRRSPPTPSPTCWLRRRPGHCSATILAIGVPRGHGQDPSYWISPSARPRSAESAPICARAQVPLSWASRAQDNPRRPGGGFVQRQTPSRRRTQRRWPGADDRTAHGRIIGRIVFARDFPGRSDRS